MARKPTPGSDDGTWGDILNAYLDVSLNSDGTLKDKVVGLANLNVATPATGQVLSYDGTGLNWTTSTGTGSVPDADATTKGLVQLAGDLGGTATSPTVPGLTAKAADTAVVHNTGAETVAGIKTFSSSPVVPTPTTNTQASNKSYVDGAVAAASGGRTAVAKSADYTASASDFVIGNASAAAFTVTLPAPTNGALVSVKKVDSSVNGILVQPASGQIDGSASVVVNTQWQSKDFFSDGTTWYNV